MSQIITRTTKRNDLIHFVNDTTTTRDSYQQQQCSPIVNFDDSNETDVVCKEEKPPSPPPLNCNNVKKCIYYCDCGDESHQSPVELFDSDDDNHYGTVDNNFTCIRYDYDNKTKENRINTTPTKYRHTKPLFTYIKESRQQQQQNNDTNQKKINELKRFDYHKSNGAKIQLNNNNDLKNPETHKNEFCTYLKLMKPKDQENNTTFLLKKRQSIRVKKRQNDNKEIVKIDESYENYTINNQYLPLPPLHIYKETTNFDDAITEIINNNNKNVENGRIVTQQCKNDLKKKRLRERVERNKYNWRRTNSLRSNGRLKGVSLEQLIRRNRLKRHYRRRRQQQQQQCRDKREKLEIIKKEQKEEKESMETTLENDERCEIITIFTINSDDDNNDNNNNDIVDNSVKNLNNEQRKEILNELIGVAINTRLEQKPQNNLKDLINFEHDYAENDDDDDDDGDVESLESSDSTTDLDDDNQHVNNVINTEEILFNDNDNSTITTTTILKKHCNKKGQQEQEQSNHSIKISETNGTIIYSKYINNHLIVVQQDLISLWTQSQLGSILNSQTMWIPNGQIKRLILNSNNYDLIKRKLTTNCIISMETTFAYIELWLKEHKSDIRKVPYCDIFATIYFWQLRQNGLDKKVLQLDNIKGSAEHVQCVVLPNVKLIVACWSITDGNERKTQIRSYLLADDYQTVASISEFASTEHHVSSLHNVEDCDNLVMGCSDNRILIWNIEHGYLISNVHLNDLKPAMVNLWVKYDRGFIFVVQQCQDKKLRLIAINGLNNSWKQLHTYGPPPLSNNFNKLTNAYIENGILIAYYKNGVLCWNTQTGKPVLEDIPNNVRYIPSGKYVIIIVNERIIIKHALTHFLITAHDL